MIRLTIHFSGQVQGVGFRYTAEDIAQRFAVCGYVQNLPDGRVLLVAEGQVDEVDTFVRDLTSRMKRYITHHDADRTPATGDLGIPGLDHLQIRR